MCPDRRRSRRTPSARLEMAIQSAFQEKCSSTMAVQGLLDGGSVMVRRVRAFTVASEMGRGGVSLAVAATFVAWYARMTLYPDEDGGVFPIV